jgi:hypothetical protein
MTPTKMRAFMMLAAMYSPILALDYGGGGGQSDEDTVMSQPVTYTVPAVETNFGTDLVDEDTQSLCLMRICCRK